MPNKPLIEPAPHEFDAYYTYLENDLQPYYAFANAIKRYNGGTEDSVTIDGEEIAFSLGYESSGIERLNHESCDLETIHEYRIKFHKRDDTGEYGGNFHIAPRSPKMEKANGTQTSSPTVTGIAVRAQGSNVPFETYPTIFRAIVRQVGIDPTYFERPSPEHSTILDAEVYLRVDRDESGPIYATDGPIEQIFQLLHDDRSGYRKRVADNTETAGYYHTATIGPKRASELLDFHKLPKEIKHYHVKHPEALPEQSPLRNPKVGVSYQHSRANEAISITAIEQVQRELEEVLLNVMQWAGLPVVQSECGEDGDDDPDCPPYIADDYFEPEFSRRQRRLVTDPTPQIQAEQEQLVYGTLADGLAPSDKDLLDLLVTDGGDVSPADAAEKTGYHRSTIYTAIDRLEHLVEHGPGTLSLKSHHVASEVHRIVEAARGKLEDAAEVAARALATDASMRRANDALTRYFDERDIEISERGTDELMIDVGRASHKDAHAQFKDVVRYWRKGGWSSDRLRDVKLRYTISDGTTVVNPHPLETIDVPV